MGFLLGCLLCTLPMGGGSRCDPWTAVVRALVAGLSPSPLSPDFIEVRLDTAEKSSTTAESPEDAVDVL